MGKYQLLSKLRYADDNGDKKIAAAKKGLSCYEYARDAVDAWHGLQRWYESKTQWVVSIASGDRLYDTALRWLLEDDVSPKPPRNVKASYSRRMRNSVLEDEFGMRTGGGVQAYSPVSVYYDESTMRSIRIGGHKINVLMHRSPVHASMDGSFKPANPDQLHFHAKSYEGQQAVISLLEEIADDTEKRKPALHMLSQWGDWMRRDDLPTRQLDSVVLKAGQMEALRDDLQGFLDDEPHYTRRAIPYHRGYMLHGPPGTGKTSIVRAMAAHFGLDLWYAPLGDLQKDASLMSLINQVRAGSILLLEDIDVFHSARDRDEDSGLSMAGLLNALDGVATPHGLITFMTTNDLSVIDPAIVRPGRVDRLEEIGMPDKDQVRRMYNFWYDMELPEEMNDTIQFQGSPAQITELFKQNLKDEVAGLKALQQSAEPAEERSVTVTPIEEKRNERAGKRGQGRSGSSAS